MQGEKVAFTLVLVSFFLVRTKYPHTQFKEEGYFNKCWFTLDRPQQRNREWRKGLPWKKADHTTVARNIEKGAREASWLL